MEEDTRLGEGLSALEYLNRFGWKATEALAIDAGTNRSYFSQIAYGHRRPSYELAQLLVEKSGNVLSLLKLLESRRPHREAKQ